MYCMTELHVVSPYKLITEHMLFEYIVATVLITRNMESNISICMMMSTISSHFV